VRVLHVLDHSLPLQSGYSFRTHAILEQQRKMGWETCQLTGPKHHGSVEPQEDVDGWQFYRTQEPDGFLNNLPVAKQVATIVALYQRLEHVIDTFRPDVLHAHSPSLNGVAALRAGKIHGIPVVYEVRAIWEDAAVNHGTSREGGLRYRLSRLLESFTLRRADAVTTICNGLRDEIVARGVPEEKVAVVPNAVNLDRFPGRRQPDPVLVRRFKPDGKPLIGFIGSFYAYEGLSLLLDAVHLLKEKPLALRALLVGGGPQEKELKEKASRLNIEDKVLFVGRVNHDEARRYYDVMDILAYPRLSMRLTELVTPLKPLEAMAQGALVVASDVGGHRELIHDGETGVLFEAGSVESLVAATSRLLEEPASWARYRRKAREFVERERNWAAIVERYREVYRAAAAGHSL